MPTASSKGKQPSDGCIDPTSRHTLSEPYPDQLRTLVFNYLCHNCYLNTAEAFAKDSTIGHIDKVGNDVPTAQDELGTQGSSADLSPELVRNILLRHRIQLEILSGNVQAAIALLNEHFPKVLAEDGGDDETVTNANASKFEYVAETVNPMHLALNLRILAFIEACRTVPLVYSPPSRQTAGTSLDTDVVMAPPSPAKRDLKDEENHQAELLICVQKLYATVNGLKRSEDRAIYLKELSNVGGLLAYTVPEDSPMAKYLDQGRRDRVAEQINSAVLHHASMPSVSRVELAVRYTHCLWAMLHELRVKVPTTHRQNGLSFPPSPQGTSEPEKEASHVAQPFDLQVLLDART